MLTLEAFNAAEGDALVVEWDGHRMVVDGGPSNGYRNRFKPVLQSLGGHVDLLCVSHVDNDHIGGIERWLYDLRDGEQGLPSIGTLWFNAIIEELERAVAASQSAAHDAIVASIAQGRHVRDVARFLGLDDGGFVTSGMESTVAGMRLRVLGPSQDRLDDLRKKWERTPLAKADAIIASYTDPSVPNLSSIVLLAEYGGRSLLLTGDARGDDLLDGITAAGLPDPLHVDVLKLPHHGSVNNMERAFFDRVTADHYVVSACGKYDHPSLDVLDWLVDSRGQDEYTIHVTNDIRPDDREKDGADVTAHLESLQAGRSFVLDVRGDQARSVRIDLP
jgi:hypothetical protein